MDNNLVIKTCQFPHADCLTGAQILQAVGGFLSIYTRSQGQTHYTRNYFPWSRTAEQYERLVESVLHTWISVAKAPGGDMIQWRQHPRTDKFDGVRGKP